MSDDVPWVRLPADWRTQVLSVGTWTADEVLDLVEEWQQTSLSGRQQLDADAFEAFVQEQADVVMAMLQGRYTLSELGEFMEKSTGDLQREAVVVALRRVYPQPHALDDVNALLYEMAEEMAAAEQDTRRRCEFCDQDELLARLRGQYRALLTRFAQYRRERYGLFLRAQP